MVGSDRDSDGDGLSDREERVAGTNPYGNDTDLDGVEDAADMSSGNPLNPDKGPREPESDRARQAREQYLAYARAILGDGTLTYAALYDRYSVNPQQGRSLDQAVTVAALRGGNSPRATIQVLAQGPLTQSQIRDLTPEAKKAALPGMLQYAQATVDQAQRQRYVEYANQATGQQWTYPDLYRVHIGSDLEAIQLDQRVTAAALGNGESPESVTALLNQGPYSQFQLGVKQVKPETIDQYAKGTVAQVQDIQALRPNQERTRQRSRDLER